MQQDLDDTSNEVNYAVEDLKQILVDVFPLLESIDIMQVEVDNELKIGQQNVKVSYCVYRDARLTDGKVYKPRLTMATHHVSSQFQIILASIAKLEESIPALITSSMAEEADTKAGQQRKEKRIEVSAMFISTSANIQQTLVLN